MKRLLALTICSVLLASASGCHLCECTNQAFGRLFGGGRAAPAQPCQTVAPCYCDPCDCGTVVTPGCGCGGGGAGIGGAVVAPSAGCGCGTPVMTPGPIPSR